MENLLRAIVRLGIFMICAQAILHFRPDDSYEKYLKMLVGIMIMLQVFLPFLNLFFGGMGDLEESIDRYREQLAEGMEQAQKITDWSEENLNQKSMEEVQRRLESKEAEEQAEEKKARESQEKESLETEETENEEQGRQEGTGEGTPAVQEEDSQVHIDKITIVPRERSEKADGDPQKARQAD